MRDFDLRKTLSLLVFAWCFFGLNPTTVLAETGSDDVAACQGAPTYGCGGVNVGGWEPWWEWIARVQIDAIDKTSSKEAYANFEDEGPALLEEGTSVRFQLEPGLSWAGYQSDLYWRVYIDYNRDGDFDDAGETVLEHSGNRASVDQNITIPAGINPGCTKIRITVQRDAYAGACESFSFGEMEDYLATLVAGPTGPVACAERDASNATICSGPQETAFYTRMVSNVSGDDAFYSAQNVEFIEYTDGTARMTGQFVNTHRSDLVFDADITYSGRTTVAPSGSPKAPLCSQTYQNPGSFYYYTETSGTMTGLQHLAGGVIDVTRMGPAMQVGVGANVHEMSPFGASGWFNYTITSQPTSAAHFETGKQTDVNIRLSGSPTACENPGVTLITLQSGVNVTATAAIGATDAVVTYGTPTATTTCAQGGLTVTRTAGLASGSTFPVGTSTVEFTATDACGNSETTSLTVTVNAGAAASISLQAGVNVTETAAAGATTATVNYATPTATTTCPQGGLTVTQTAGLASGSAFPIGTSTVSFTATDACGNSETTSLTVTVNPSAPTGNCTGSGPTYACNGPIGGEQPWHEWISQVQFAGLDNSSSKEGYKFFDQLTPTAVTAGTSESMTLTPGLSWGGYQSDLYFVACIDFNQDGDFNDPGEEVLRANSISAAVSGIVQIPAGATPGVTRMRIFMKKGAYVTNSCERFVYGEIEDYLICVGGGTNNGTLTLNGPADQSVTIAAGQTTATVTFSDATGSTTCPTGGFAVTQTSGPTSGSALAAGTYTVVYTATDDCGNTETSSTLLTVSAVNSGTLTLNGPADQTVTIAAGQIRALISFVDATGSTTCPTGGFTVSQTSGPTSGTAQRAGTYTVVFTASDACGNTETTSTVITVNPPAATSISLTCPADVTTPQIATYGADVFIPVPTATTTCGQGGLTFTYDPQLPANRTPHFAVGTSTVTITATDACGNTATCSYTVTVTPDNTGGGSCTGTAPAYPCNGVNVGGWEPWWEWISRVQFAGIDNSSSKEAYKFFDQVAPASVIPGSSATLDITPGLSWAQYQTDLFFTAYIDWNRDGDFDDAGEEVLRDNTTSLGVTVTVNVPSNAVVGLTRLRVVMQRDAYAGACESFSFGEMEDYLVCIGGTTPPVSSITLNCAANSTSQIAQGQTTASLGYTVPTATTTCATGGLTVARTSGPGPNASRAAGTYTIEYTATDACGNSENCSFTVTVLAPAASSIAFNCTANSTVQIAQGQTDVALGYTVPTATTTCTAGGLTVVRTSGPASTATRGAGTYLIHYTATDACGNSESCNFTVTVLAPAPSSIAFNCSANSTVQLAQGQAQVALGYTVPTATTTCNAGGLTVVRTSGPASTATRGAGTYQIHYTATDACGNSESCNFTVTVLAPTGPPVCATRIVTENEACWTSSLDYSFYDQSMIGNVAGKSDYYSFVNGSLVELTDGTAKLTGRVVNNSRSDLFFDVDVSLSGRTQNAPSGSPKNPGCNQSYPSNSELYYYPVASGTLTGGGILSGGIINLTRVGASFQLGTGANLNEVNRFGASGWFDAHIVSQPTGVAHFVSNKVVDFNINLSGATNACINTGTGIDPCASNMLANPGFENGLTGWHFLNGAKLTTSPVNSGHDALRLDHTGSYAYQSFTATPGQDWALRFYAKDHSTGTNSAAAIQYRDAQGHLISDEVISFNTGAFQLYNATGTAPAGTADVIVMFFRPSSGTNNEAWVDDVCFSIQTGTTPTGSCNNNILFVVGDANLNAADQAVLDKLISKGYTVMVKDALWVSTADANGRGLVIISSTVHSGDVGTKFTHVTVPVMTWESYLYDDLSMTGHHQNTDYGTLWNAEDLVSVTSHPINAGLSGTRTFATSHQDWRFGVPSSSATIVARVAGQSTSKPAIFVYDAGDHMVGQVAPAIRIGFHFSDHTATHLTANGWNYFTQAVAWATDCSASASARTAAPINLYASATEQGVELNWITNLTAGDDMFELQRENASGNWDIIASLNAPVQTSGAESFDYLDVAPSIGTNNYRVIVVSSLESRESPVRSVDYLSADAVTAYPNPASDQLFVSLKGFSGFDVDIIVYNALGQEQSRTEVLGADDNPVLLQTGNFKSGIYTVYAVAGGAKKAMRVKIINE
ncbi:MAG: HYR domain-containing protein [Saprospiraceae bacterium]